MYSDLLFSISSMAKVHITLTLRNSVLSLSWAQLTLFIYSQSDLDISVISCHFLCPEPFGDLLVNITNRQNPPNSVYKSCCLKILTFWLCCKACWNLSSLTTNQTSAPCIGSTVFFSSFNWKLITL